ncbi:hypothetical protein AUJ46_04355 [Candidatus Peregrinibacteria bacterium CG1_02_54_53]|nr:MAG: hypothetical protein AUJ46_04355 [Candidatus Peregrinibacteria bacterium CG1_02_54_53]
MHPEVLNNRPTSPLSVVRIDCSQSPKSALTGVLQWVSACPERGDLHIVLPSVRGQPAVRSALLSLQQLGCRVTLRVTQGHPERPPGCCPARPIRTESFGRVRTGSRGMTAKIS